MSYGDTGPAFAWTNTNLRHPNKWTITPYLANSAVTAAAVTCYSYDVMQTTLGKMQKLAVATNCYDQIVVTTNKEAVPSAADTGTDGDSI